MQQKERERHTFNHHLSFIHSVKPLLASHHIWRLGLVNKPFISRALVNTSIPSMHIDWEKTFFKISHQTVLLVSTCSIVTILHTNKLWTLPSFSVKNFFSAFSFLLYLPVSYFYKTANKKSTKQHKLYICPNYELIV